MTNDLFELADSQQPAQSSKELVVEPPSAGRMARIQFWTYLTVTIGVLVFLLWPGGNKPKLDSAQAATPKNNPVQLSNDWQIHIQPDSPLHRKLQTSGIKLERIVAPVLKVTGTVVACLRSGKGNRRDWQFNSPELLTAYTDWQRAVTDITFARTQLDSIKQLAENRVAAQTALVHRLKKLVEAGTDTEKDLVTAQTDLLQAQIQGRKDLHEAETAYRLAQRSEATLSHQLQQTGVEPELLRVTGSEVDIVVADVPEVMLSRVKLGQGCEAKFFGISGKTFPGSVSSISPVLSAERRSLRVLFTVRDPDDLLRPGMFADIGLGTDAREALLAPIAGVVHVGRLDFMLVRVDGGSFRIANVKVGELHDSFVEILDGIQAGEQVVGKGAILLKPFIVEATQRKTSQRAAG